MVIVGGFRHTLTGRSLFKYLKIQSVPQRKHRTDHYKTIRLILFKEIIASYTENNMTHMITKC
jgi:hypothetical protein